MVEILSKQLKTREKKTNKQTSKQINDGTTTSLFQNRVKPFKIPLFNQVFLPWTVT